MLNLPYQKIHISAYMDHVNEFLSTPVGHIETMFIVHSWWWTQFPILERSDEWRMNPQASKKQKIRVMNWGFQNCIIKRFAAFQKKMLAPNKPSCE